MNRRNFFSAFIGSLGGIAAGTGEAKAIEPVKKDDDLQIIYYETGNRQAQAEAIEAARQISRGQCFVFPCSITYTEPKGKLHPSEVSVMKRLTGR